MAATQALEERHRVRSDLIGASTVLARRIGSIKWIRNERRLALEWSDTRASGGGATDKALCRKARKLRDIAFDKPDDLLLHLDRFEDAQPWSQKLATTMADIERRLMGF